MSALPDHSNTGADPLMARDQGTLRIGIEAHVVGARPSGNGRVVANLIGAMSERSADRLFVYMTDPEQARAWNARRRPGMTVRLVPAHPLVRIPFALPYLAARDRLDVFVSHDNRPPLAPCPVITLVHDVAFAGHPEFFSPYERLWMRRTIPASLRRSDHILTVSEFTKNEIVRAYGIPAGRITVAHNGVDPIFLEHPRVPSVVEPPFFLSVGNLQPRKNLTMLAEAYRRFIDRHPNAPERLVLAGQESHGSGPLLRETGDLRRSGRVVFTGYLSDEQLVALLSAATAFAYPSLYEGFGLPPMEAMASGTPTAVSDIPVMREIVGDDAIRLPPTDPDAWAGALDRLSRDPSLRARLKEAGRARASRFSWERAADTALKAIHRTVPRPH